jgi:hypothetical protein
MRRAIAAVVAIGAACVLGLAAWLTPSPTGLGTHSIEMNLPACGWITLMDLPCPTCGMTTSFAHAANGNLLRSFLTQPMGCLLAIATAVALLAGLYIATTGSRLGILFTRLWGRRTGWWIAGVAVFAWGFKVLSYKGVL